MATEMTEKRTRSKRKRQRADKPDKVVAREPWWSQVLPVITGKTGLYIAPHQWRLLMKVWWLWWVYLSAHFHHCPVPLACRLVPWPVCGLLRHNNMTSKVSAYAGAISRDHSLREISRRTDHFGASITINACGDFARRMNGKNTSW